MGTRKLYKQYKRFISSIHGRVIFVITGSLLVLFILFNIVFRSIYIDFFNTTIRQSGNNISSIVEGSLYYSMLENDKSTLQQTLDVISTMSGIDQVNMYDVDDNLAYTSIGLDDMDTGDPNCKNCHDNLEQLFPTKLKSYHIVGDTSNCGVFESNQRQLLIRTPIVNEPSCYTANCHAHSKTDEVLGSLIIKLPLNNLDAIVDESSTDFFLIAIVITVFLLVFLILFVRKRIQNPLNSIINASEAVSKGDKSIRLEIRPELLSDLKMVSLAFNNMLDNIESATSELQNWSYQLEYKVQKKSEELSDAHNELIHVERIASLGKLSSSVAHEINNPLSGILVYTKLVHKQISSPDCTHPKKKEILKHLKYVENETKRCGDIVKGLLDFSRKDQDGFTERSINELMESTCDLMTHSVKIADIRMNKRLDAGNDVLLCSPNQIKQAFFAVLVNSAEAIHENGEINVRTSNPDEETILIEIEDNGSGITTEDLAHIFEPFYSTKRDSSGIGLGLAIVHGIIDNHKGRIDVKSDPGNGTIISITLPLDTTKNE